MEVLSRAIVNFTVAPGVTFGGIRYRIRVYVMMSVESFVRKNPDDNISHTHRYSGILEVKNSGAIYTFRCAEYFEIRKAALWLSENDEHDLFNF